MQNRDLTIRERVLLILGMAHDMQVRINRQEMFACSDVIEKYGREGALEHVRDYLEGNALCGFYGLEGPKSGYEYPFGTASGVLSFYLFPGAVYDGEEVVLKSIKNGILLIKEWNCN